MEMNELLKIEARCKAATPGPWRNDRSKDHTMSEVWGPKGIGYGAIVTAYPCFPLERQANKDFIAASRTDIPALIAALREAWKERDQLRQLCDRMSAILCHDDTDKLSPMKVLADFDQLFPKE